MRLQSQYDRGGHHRLKTPLPTTIGHPRYTVVLGGVYLGKASSTTVDEEGLTIVEPLQFSQFIVRH